MPAGYMELDETVEEGAAREVWEEACAKVELDGLLMVFSIPRIAQVHLIYRARMLTPDHAPGPESEEVGLFRWDEIPWSDLAYPNVASSLEYERETKDRNSFVPRSIRLPQS